MIRRWRAHSIALAASRVLPVAFVFITAPRLAAKDPRGAVDILRRIDELVGDRAGQACRDVGLSYPPRVVLLRGFKKERELEVWAGNDAGPLRLVRTLPICAIAAERGPKVKPYDKRTPEGFFRLRFRYRSQKPWMWVKLESDRVDAFGIVGDGSPFFLHLDYPNAVDRSLSEAAGFRAPRGEICLHGNCVTEGCVSLTNRDYLLVFAFVAHHDSSEFGAPQLHLFPFRMGGDWDVTLEAADYVHLRSLGPATLRWFWKNLEEGFQRFDRTHQPLTWRYGPMDDDPSSSSMRLTGYVFRGAVAETH